jgi:N-methylhydantoinase B
VLEARDGDLRAAAEATVAGTDGARLHGSADQHDGNLNCPLAVTLSACYFALRVLTDPTCRPAPAPTARSR